MSTPEKRIPKPAAQDATRVRTKKMSTGNTPTSGVEMPGTGKVRETKLVGKRTDGSHYDMGTGTAYPTPKK